MKLTDLDIIKLLPNFMKDDHAVNALSRAINRLIQEPAEKINLLRVWDQIDNLDHADLDELAWELNVDWYSSSMSLDAKRRTIKYAQQIQAKRGTKWAVEQLITAYYGEGHVSEWFEYGGEPYMFSVRVTNTEIKYLTVTDFIRSVNSAKSVRSHLDKIIFSAGSVFNRDDFIFIDFAFSVSVNGRLRPGGIILDGSYNFDATWILDAAYKSVSLEKLELNGLSVKQSYNLTGTITWDNYWLLNGEVMLNGSKTLEPNEITEVL